MVSIGTAMIFSMVETIKSFLDEQIEEVLQDLNIVLELDDLSFEPEPAAKSVYVVPSVRDHLAACGRRLPIAEGVTRPKIYHGETIVDRKSVFQVRSVQSSYVKLILLEWNHFFFFIGTLL